MDTIYDAKLLIVDDNAELLALLCEQLRGAGYGHIRTAQSCTAARACFAAEQPELMILDINLPDGDGFSLFRALRAKADVPALFLSARDADADRLFGLGLGADDYLTKPFLMQELLLRVQHILQRAYRAELSRTKPAPLQLGERCVDLNDAIVTLSFIIMKISHWRRLRSISIFPARQCMMPCAMGRSSWKIMKRRSMWRLHG